MKKKIIISLVMIAFVFIIAGCGENNSREIKETAKESVEAKADSSGSCKEEKVSLPNYGDPGKRLKNCFVEYPGESSRPDKSYYVVEDICGQFTKEFVENALGKKITRVELPKISTINNCTYYFDEKEYVMLNLEYLSIENQKKGNEAMDRKVEKSSQIPMDNLVVYEENSAINAVYLILNPEKFLSIRPSSLAAKKMMNLVDFASNMAKEIKGYK
ncbi:MAG: hypothetical protein WC906_01370 [Parcubacteria group bacterium]|jgi:hypothetical protein